MVPEVSRAHVEARRLLRRKALEFDGANSGKGLIDYASFCECIVPHARIQVASGEIRSWWELMGGGQELRKQDFFLYALAAASRKSGSGISQIFATYDKDQSGELDELEFERALEEMGFGDVATSVFEEHAYGEGGNGRARALSGAGCISYHDMLKAFDARTK